MGYFIVFRNGTVTLFQKGLNSELYSKSCMELFFLEKYIWKNTATDKKKLMFASVMETIYFHSMYCLLMFLPGMINGPVRQTKSCTHLSSARYHELATLSVSSSIHTVISITLHKKLQFYFIHREFQQTLVSVTVFVRQICSIKKCPNTILLF